MRTYLKDWGVYRRDSGRVEFLEERRRLLALTPRISQRCSCADATRGSVSQRVAVRSHFCAAALRIGVNRAISLLTSASSSAGPRRPFSAIAAPSSVNRLLATGSSSV